MIFIVPHEKVRAKAWAQRTRGSFTVLADSGFAASAAYGVAFQMRIHTDTSNTPGTFLIGTDGVLKWAYIGKGKRNWNDRPKPQTVLKQVRALAAAP